jgi:hypothetical protein
MARNGPRLHGKRYCSIWLYSYHSGWEWNPNRKSEAVQLIWNHTAFLPLKFKGGYHAIQVTRGVSKGIHEFDIHLEIVEDDFTNPSGNLFSIGVANEYFDMNNAYNGWTASNGGIGMYRGKTIKFFVC